MHLAYSKRMKAKAQGNWEYVRPFLLMMVMLFKWLWFIRLIYTFLFLRLVLFFIRCQMNQVYCCNVQWWWNNQLKPKKKLFGIHLKLFSHRSHMKKSNGTWTKTRNFFSTSYHYDDANANEFIQFWMCNALFLLQFHWNSFVLVSFFSLFFVKCFSLVLIELKLAILIYEQHGAYIHNSWNS